MSLDAAALADEMLLSAEDAVARAVAPLRAELAASAARLAAAEGQIAVLIAALARQPVDGKDGAIGPQGEPGPRGERGEPGPAGRDGIDGKDGVSGLRGEQGPQGECGPQGDRGPEGPPGRDGVDGKDGAPGERGEAGPAGERGQEGPAGKLPICRAWVEGVHYESDVVAHVGATWQALRDTGHEPPHADWLCLAAPGRDGAGFVVRGTFAPDTGYRRGDIVMVNRSSFVALSDDPGACPGDGWQLWAGAGSKGAQGERGPAGPQGVPGRDAEQIVAFYEDKDGVPTITLASGREMKMTGVER